MHSVGSQLKAWRKAAGLQQDEAAAILDLSPSTYQNYERDTRAPNTAGWVAFARAGINTNWLLINEGPMLISELSTMARVNMLLVERDALAESLQKALEKAWAAQVPQINVDALVQAIAAIFQVAPKGDSIESLARKAVAFYQYCEQQGLITKEGQGDGVLKDSA